jgi:hypothetical protein
MWYRFVLAGRKEIEQRFGKNVYQIVQTIPSNLQEPAALFSQGIVSEDSTMKIVAPEQIVSIFKTVEKLLNKKAITISRNKNEVVVVLNSTNTSDNFYPTVDGFIKFCEKIDFYYTLLMPQNTQAQEDSETELNIPEGQITIKKANNVMDAINYGKGTTWCISQPKNTMYQSYRLQKSSTFYFIFDTTRPEGDPLRRVVVDVTIYGIELTDLRNNTGTISEFGKNEDAYMEYLENKGVDIGQFKNDPYTEEEEQEYEFLSDRAYYLEDFISLHARAKAKKIDDVYSKYIGFGHMLSSEQLKFLIENNAKPLVNQYVTTGNPIHKADLPLLDNQQTRTYLRRRNMMYDDYKDQYVGYNNIPDAMLFYLDDDQFIDEVFFENLLKDGANKVSLLGKFAEVNYNYNGYDSLIDRLLNENFTPNELDTITWSLLYFGNIKILEKFLKLYPQQLQMIEDQNLLVTRSVVYNHNLMNYLYDTINKPQLFVKPASESMVFEKNYEGCINDLINDGYADKLMESLLSWNDYLASQIDYLLKKGASLEKAWNIASTQSGVNKHNRDHLYILMKEKHPKYIEEWMKEKNPTLKPQFDPEKYIEPQMPVSDETSDPPKETQSFNLNKYLMKSGKYYVV